KARLQEVRERKQRIKRQLESESNELNTGRAVLASALELLDRPRDLYETATTEARKTLNRAVFTRLYLDSFGRAPKATREALAEPYAGIVHASRSANASCASRGSQEAPDDRTEHRARLLALC